MLRVPAILTMRIVFTPSIASLRDEHHTTF